MVFDGKVLLTWMILGVYPHFWNTPYLGFVDRVPSGKQVAIEHGPFRVELLVKSGNFQYIVIHGQKTINNTIYFLFGLPTTKQISCC